MSPNLAFQYALAICLAGAVLTLLLSRWKTLAGWAAFGAVLASSALVMEAALTVLGHGAAPRAVLFTLPALGPCRIVIDGLSAIFLLLISVIAVLSSLYSVRYMDHYEEYGVARYYPHFLLFIAGMYGIVVVTDLMVYFCAFWQLMTLPSFALVRYEFKKQENVRAANRYLLMMEVSCGLVMAGAALLGSGTTPSGDLGAYDFEVLSKNISLMLTADAFTAGAALFLFLIGFGIKAGMWPFGQLWLPAAHPAAPSPVSALLSGVMIKTGVYGLLRSFLWLVPAGFTASYPAGAWGLIIAILGTATLFFGTIQALKQEESKRLLAFHSIGQVGYILLGLGACLALLPASGENYRLLAAMGLAGALFHTINHGLFKSLLFLNAGSVLYATGTQNLNRIGGLMKYMPVTGVMTLIASFSIAGVPLFNGFGSKWTIYVSTVLGSSYAPYLAVLALFAIVTSGLTLASFIKFFGTSFLSRASALVTQRLEKKRGLEVDWTMVLPQLFLGACCLLFGLFPQVALRLLKSGVQTSDPGIGLTLAEGFPVSQPLAVSGPAGQAVIVPFVLGAVLLGMLLLAWVLSRSGGSQRRTAAPWLCGYALEAEGNRYTAHGLYGEVKRYLRWAGGTARR